MSSNLRETIQKIPLVTWYAVYETQLKSFAIFWTFLAQSEKTKIFFLWKPCFSQIIPLGSSNGISATPPKFFGQKSSKCLIQVRKAWKRLQFLKKISFFPERSSRLIESSFDKHSELILLKVRNWQNKSSNVRMKIRKKMLWSCNLQLIEPSQKILPISVLFGSMFEKEECFFCEIIFLSKCSCEVIQRIFGRLAR